MFVYFVICVLLLVGDSRADCSKKAAASTATEKVLFNFSTATVDDFSEQSDTVRAGGLSKAAIVIHNNTAGGYRRAVFFGLLNPLANGAAFAGVRRFGNDNLSGYGNLVIRCRGQGTYKGFKIVLRHKCLNADSDNTYEQFFTAPQGVFGEVKLPFSGFKAHFRGQEVTDAIALDQSEISTFGFQAYGGVYENVKQSGVGSLEIDYVKATK